MTVRPTTPALGELGTQLRSARGLAGLTGAQLAETLGEGWRTPKVSKIENGRQLPTEDELRAWAEATGSDRTALLVLRDRAVAEYRTYRDDIKRAGGPLAHQRNLAEQYASFTHLVEFQPALVPGFLQTAAYIREIAATGMVVPDGADPEETLRRVVAAKIRWQALLHEPGREFVHVVTEAALRLRIGAVSPSTLRGQLHQLADLATLPGHTFGVVPFSSPCPAMPSGFSIYDHDLVVVESSAGVVELTDPDVVARYRGWLDQLLDVALTGGDAAAFCRDVAASG